MGPMGSTQTLHRVTIGRTREVRGPDGLERGVVGIIIAAVAAIAVWFGVQLVCTTQTLDAISLASGAEINAITYRAVHGRWPPAGTPDIIATGTRSHYVKRLALSRDGVITGEVTLGPVQGIMTRPGGRVTGTTIHGLLSFRPELLGSHDAPSIVFLCGYARPVADPAGVSGANRTTLPRQYLPPFCR
jgi:hypothetical protein